MIKIKTKKGSALIIALLIMGILMTLALGLSDLVIREVKVTRDIVNSGIVYYSAEAGIESALLDLHQRLPGYEGEDGVVRGETLSGYDTGEESLNFDYKIENKTKVIPYLDTKIVNPNAISAADTYAVLDLNESVTIPLFIADGVDDIQNVTDFRVDYYLNAEIDQKWSQYALDDIDILRWKVTGMREARGPDDDRMYYTESIGDYIPAHQGSNSESPTAFGTLGADNLSLDYPEENSINYPAVNYLSTEFAMARQAYTYEFFENEDGDRQIKTVFSIFDPDVETPEEAQRSFGKGIKEFITEHSHNYLTITNIFNPSMLAKRKTGKLYYRIVIPNEGEYTIRDTAKISSTGYLKFGLSDLDQVFTQSKIRQHIEAFIAPDRFMPVFNFSLYRTKVGGEDDVETIKGFIKTQEDTLL